MVPNAEHSLIGHQYDVIEGIAMFFKMIATNTPRPDYTYEIVKSNTTASITGNDRYYKIKVTKNFLYS